MIFRFFKQSLPQVLVVIILLTMLLWGKSFFRENPYNFYYDYTKMPFYQILTDILPNKNIYKILISFLVLLFTGLYLLQINSKHIIIKNRSYFPALIFFLIISSVPSLQRLNPAIFSTVLLIFVFDHLFSIYHKNDVLDNLFKSGFFIAIASLFYAPAAFYLLTLILSILSLRTFNLREITAAIIGFLTPWFFYSFYCYLFRDNWSIGVDLLKDNLLAEVDHSMKFNYLFYVYAGFFLLLFIITGFFLINSLQNQKIIVRKYFGVFYWFNLFSALIVLFIPGRSTEIIYLISIPIAFQFAYYFSLSTKKFWPSFFFYTMLIVVLLSQIIPEKMLIA